MPRYWKPDKLIAGAPCLDDEVSKEETSALKDIQASPPRGTIGGYDEGHPLWRPDEGVRLRCARRDRG
jgi:hypothetical protein